MPDLSWRMALTQIKDVSSVSLILFLGLSQAEALRERKLINGEQHDV